MIRDLAKNIDWFLFAALVPIVGAGLFAMNSFSPDNQFFDHQLVWAVIAGILMLALSFADFRFLRQGKVLLTLFGVVCSLLVLLFLVGKVSHGAQSWFSIGGFSFQPSDPLKIVLVLMLAKYFSRRHVEIANFKHLFISGLYAAVPFTLVLLEPDFGQALVIFAIWFGMVLVSGISKKHLALVFLAALAAFLLLWFFAFQPYQKQRIVTFIHPLTDVRGAGYNAYQSTIAVGSGQLFGKGVGYGTQSRLKFLPEYQTDFIFAAFAEEWGFMGVLILLFLFGVVMWRLLANAMVGGSNFEMLYCFGLVIWFMTHIVINIGMNIGVMPVTGITLPFMSYGGSHLLTEATAVGILMGMRKYARAAHRDLMKNEFVGI